MEVDVKAITNPNIDELKRRVDEDEIIFEEVDEGPLSILNGHGNLLPHGCGVFKRMRLTGCE